MTVRGVTFNLGGAGPGAAEYRSAAYSWVDAALGHYDLVFAQEVHDEAWFDLWRERYEVFEGCGRKYRARSAVIVSKSIRSLSQPPLATARYHGSYVAVAEIELRGIGPVTLVSVHASPSEVTDKWLGWWTADCKAEPPSPREGFRLWDSDMVLASVRMLPKVGSLLVAGDWNEARLWDADHPPGTSGMQFFERVAAAGLIDCAHSRWGIEKPTHDGRYQLDHVFASERIATHIRTIDVVEAGPRAGGSDHKPIEFEIDV